MYPKCPRGAIMKSTFFFLQLNNNTACQVGQTMMCVCVLGCVGITYSQTLVIGWSWSAPPLYHDFGALFLASVGRLTRDRACGLVVKHEKYTRACCTYLFFSSIAHVSPRIWRQWYGNRKYICHWEERCAIHEINVMMELCEIITYGLFTGNIDPQTLQIMLNIYICSSHPIQTVLCETSITPYDRFHLYLSISSPS